MEISTAALWINSYFASFDLNVTTFIHNLFFKSAGFFTPFFEFVSFLGKDGIVLIILSFVLIAFRRNRRYGTAMLIAVTIGALLTNCCLKILIARPRPYADTGSEYYRLWLTVGQNLESDKSFPSGHTTAAFATMTALFLSGKRSVSWTAFIFAILMGVSRIYLVVHFPTDVIGGVIVGLVGGIAGYIISVKLPEGWYRKEFFKKKSKI